ncbi:MAG TPA: hypothetical protein VG755_35615 [Nannocystaceae bacterium]|nr:hypothetical protein [Nannocystaceae bacterium]
MDGGSALRLGLCCTIAASGAVVLASACGDGLGDGPLQTHEFEQALCHKLIECGCGESLRAYGLQPPLTCDGWTLESLIGPGPDPDPYYYGYGYEYDPDPDEQLPVSLDIDCFERIADALERGGCDAPIVLSCEDYCSPYFGPLLEGEPCSDAYACGRGLQCDNGECRDPCKIQLGREGDRCGDPQGQYDIECGDGLVCGFNFEYEYPTCLRLPGPGLPCDGDDCAPGSWCDDNGTDVPTCRPSKETGAACMGHRECKSIYCPAGSCEDRPVAGSACGTDSVCAAGSDCIHDETSGSGRCVAVPLVCQSALELLPYR